MARKEPDTSDDQKEAVAEVKAREDDRGPFVVAAETTRMAMVFADARAPENPIIFANESFLALTGYTEKEVLGQSFNFLMAHAADSKARALIDAEFRGSSSDGVDILYRRKDGSEFWASLFVCPVRDKGGDIVQYFASYVDLTRHKDQEIHSKMLIDELNHRVKNILATVQSIVWQASQTASDPKVIREAIEGRLAALARSHDLLTREHWQGAGLLDMLTDALEPFRIRDGRAERLSIRGENIRFPPKEALALSIAFTELATNAVKYGAFSNATGSILVEWRSEPKPGGDRIILCWREKDGPPVTSPLHQGFGTTLLERGLAHELEGGVHLDYRPEGLICTMNIPAPTGST